MSLVLKKMDVDPRGDFSFFSVGLQELTEHLLLSRDAT